MPLLNRYIPQVHILVRTDGIERFHLVLRLNLQRKGALFQAFKPEIPETIRGCRNRFAAGIRQRADGILYNLVYVRIIHGPGNKPFGLIEVKHPRICSLFGKHDLGFFGIRGRGTGIRIDFTSVICTFSEGPLALSTTRNCYITVWIMPASFDGVYSGLHPSLPIPQKLGESRDVEVYFTGLEIAQFWPDAPNFFRRLLDLK